MDSRKICDCCDGGPLTNEMLPQVFQFGCDDEAVMLSAVVEVTTCLACGEQWTGEQGELARQAAVDKHLAALQPTLAVVDGAVPAN